MTRNRNFVLLCVCLLSLAGTGQARASSAPVAAHVIQSGLPDRPGALADVTQALFNEYSASDNVLSLVFHAYGMLRQARYFLTTGDFIQASEYAKTGFFYLDEAVDLHEADPRVRYLRARVDAWLAADIGRCVVTLKDTALMLDNTQVFNAGLVEHLIGMRYRALLSCEQQAGAEALLAKLTQQNPDAAASLTSDRAPEWDMNEVRHVLLPLLEGK